MDLQQCYLRYDDRSNRYQYLCIEDDTEEEEDEDEESPRIEYAQPLGRKKPKEKRKFDLNSHRLMRYTELVKALEEGRALPDWYPQPGFPRLVPSPDGERVTAMAESKHAEFSRVATALVDGVMSREELSMESKALIRAMESREPGTVSTSGNPSLQRRLGQALSGLANAANDPYISLKIMSAIAVPVATLVLAGAFMKIPAFLR